jgi:hypothetical protein
MLDAALTAKLEGEGWHVDWGGDALADALAAREEEGEDGGGTSAAAAAPSLAELRAALLDADLRKVPGRWGRARGAALGRPSLRSAPRALRRPARSDRRAAGPARRRSRRPPPPAGRRGRAAGRRQPRGRLQH